MNIKYMLLIIKNIFSTTNITIIFKMPGDWQVSAFVILCTIYNNCSNCILQGGQGTSDYMFAYTDRRIDSSSLYLFVDILGACEHLVSTFNVESWNNRWGYEHIWGVIRQIYDWVRASPKSCRQCKWTGAQ